MKKRIVVFASGSGTNTQNVIQYFQHREVAEVVLVLTNKKDAKVLERAKALEIKALSFTKSELLADDGVVKILEQTKPDLIVLAGFLLMFPAHILKQFPNKVINIHPALLPKYGGKGMYGHHVHEAVVANEEEETGITVHFVNEQYDEGAIILQKKVSLELADTPEIVAGKIHELEYRWLPKVIEELLTDVKVDDNHSNENG